MHIYNRLSVEQMKLILSWYTGKKIPASEAQMKLGVKRREFFYLVKKFKEGKLETVGSKGHAAANRISETLEATVRKELEAEKEIIGNPDVPTDRYNYAFVRDEVVRKTGRKLSAETVRRRAHEWGFFIVSPKKEKAHTRIILTEKPGVLVQHDASVHLFAPLGGIKWHLITALDDFSRKLLFADFFPEETAWDHIVAARFVFTVFGCPANYYADNHSIFRYVERMESFWKTKRVDHKSVLTAWETCLKVLGTGVIHALSPQAKGKIERPYRWMQDRIVRRCAKEQVRDIAHGKIILREEVARYNQHTVHSTTGEIPDVRFEREVTKGNTAFTSFSIPAPYRAIEDVFCLRETRKVSGYQTVSWRNHFLKLPGHIPIGSEVILHIVPDKDKPMGRIWFKGELLEIIFLGPDPRRKALVDACIKEEKK